MVRLDWNTRGQASRLGQVHMIHQFPATARNETRLLFIAVLRTTRQFDVGLHLGSLIRTPWEYHETAFAA